jgi:hypothetical protein
LEEKWVVLGNEVEVELSVPGLPVPVKQVLDLVVEDQELGEPVVVEWKWSKSVWGFVARPNSQIVGYARGARELTGGTVRRVLFHTCGLFISSNGGVIPGKKSEEGRSIFTREPIDLDDWDFEEWEADLLEKWAELLGYLNRGYFPKRTRSCGDYGGCPFQPLCVAPPGQRRFFGESNFAVRPEEVS